MCCDKRFASLVDVQYKRKSCKQAHKQANMCARAAPSGGLPARPGPQAAPSGGLPARPGPQAAPQRPQPDPASPRPSCEVSRSRPRGLLSDSAGTPPRPGGAGRATRWRSPSAMASIRVRLMLSALAGAVAASSAALAMVEADGCRLPECEGGRPTLGAIL